MNLKFENPEAIQLPDIHRLLADRFRPHALSACEKTGEDELTIEERCAIAFFGGVPLAVGDGGRIRFSRCGIWHDGEGWRITMLDPGLLPWLG